MSLTPKQLSDYVQRLLPPVPALRVSARQQAMLGRIEAGTDVPTAMKETGCTLRDAALLHSRLSDYFERFAVRRLAALRELGRHAAMWGPLRKISEECGESYPNEPELASALVGVLSVKGLSLVERIAYGMLLDYYSPGWRSKLPPEVLGPLLGRDDAEVAAWRKAVFKRDGHRCQDCGLDRNLNAHHIFPWAKFPELRVAITNGVTLCAACHGKRHRVTEESEP
jgi:hypothetical protein